MIDKSNKIHPTAVLEGNVEIGKKNIIEANVVIEGTLGLVVSGLYHVVPDLVNKVNLVPSCLIFNNS